MLDLMTQRTYNHNDEQPIQPIDLKFSYKSPSSLVKFIERDGNLEKLKKFEGVFEWDECCWTMKL